MPGLALVAGGVGVAAAVHGLAPSVSALVVAVVSGALLTNLGLVPARCRPGTDLAARRFLRAGIVLLGLQLAVGDVLRLGAPKLAVVVTVVAATFVGTRVVGHWLGVSPRLSLLIATGFSICGASAVAAMNGVSPSDEDDVAFSIGLVTLCGSLAILVLPLLRGPLALDAAAFGAWAGASVHDVAQVVATASVGGTVALQTAVVVKLTRVVLLAPMVSVVALLQRRAESAAGRLDAPSGAAAKVLPARSAGGDRTRGGNGLVAARSRRPPALPLFVIGFLAAVAVRSTGVLPAGVLSGLRTTETLLLTAAVFALGTGVRLSRLRRLGGRPLLLGLAAWVLVGSISYVGIRLVGAA